MGRVLQKHSREFLHSTTNLSTTPTTIQTNDTDYNWVNASRRSSAGDGDNQGTYVASTIESKGTKTLTDTPISSLKASYKPTTHPLYKRRNQTTENSCKRKANASRRNSRRTAPPDSYLQSDSQPWLRGPQQLHNSTVRKTHKTHHHSRISQPE